VSWQAVRYAVDTCRHLENLSTLDRLVLLLVAEHARADGSNAYPSSVTLAEAAGVRDDSVRRSLARLVRTGAIAAEVRPGRPTRYRFPLSTPVAPVQQVVEGDLLPWSTDPLPQGNRGVAGEQREPSGTGHEPAVAHITDDCRWCATSGVEINGRRQGQPCRAGCAA